jgi:hypothetical protein
MTDNNFLSSKLPLNGFYALPTVRSDEVWKDIKSDFVLTTLELSALKEARCSGFIKISLNIWFYYYLIAAVFV